VATKKITQLPTASAVLPTDLVPIVDLNDTMTQKATWSQVAQGLDGLVATLTGSHFSGPVTASLGVSASFGSFGTADTATTGLIRLAGGDGIYARHSSNPVNMPMLLTSVSDALFLGTSPLYNAGDQFSDIRIYSTEAGYVYIGNGASSNFYVGGGAVTSAVPIMANGGLSGSLTRLTGGTSYLVAGANTTIVTQSNGSILITATGGTAAAGGNTGDFQYNNLGALAGVSGLSYNGAVVDMALPVTASWGLSASFVTIDTGGSLRVDNNGTTIPLFTYDGVSFAQKFGDPTGTAYTSQFHAASYGYMGNVDAGTFYLANTAGPELSGYVSSVKLYEANSVRWLSHVPITASLGVSASFIQVDSSDGTTNTGYLAVGGTNVPTEGMLRLGSDTGGYRDIIKVRQNGADWSFLNIHNAGASYINVGPTPSVGYAMTWRGYNHLFHGYDGIFDFYREGTGTYPLRIGPTTGATFSVPVTASVGISGSHGSFGVANVAVSGALRLGNASTINFRNALNSADVQLATVTAGNNLLFGHASNPGDLYLRTATAKTIFHEADLHEFRTAAGSPFTSFSTTLANFTSSPISTTGYIRVNSTESGDAIQIGNNMWVVGQKLAGGKLYLLSTNAVDDVIVGTPSNPGVLYLQGGVLGSIYNAAAHYFRNADHSLNWGYLGGGTSDFFSFGASPATTGYLRLPNVATVKSRNALNNADLTLLESNASNQLVVGGTNVTQVGGKAINKNQIGHRLTLSSSNPVPTTEAISGSTLYLTPYVGNQIALWDNTTWWQYEVDEVSLALSGLTANTNYDVFLYMNGGTATLTTVAWSTATARATSLARRDGVLVLSSSHTRRYVGTIRSVSTTQTEDSSGRRFVWNYYNRVPRQMKRLATFDGPVAYNGVLRPYNNDTNHAIAYVCGEDVEVEARGYGMVKYTASDWGGAVNIGIDSTTVGSATMTNGAYTIANAFTWPTAEYRGAPGLGYHYLMLLQQAGNAVNFYGDGGSPTYFQSGMVGSVFG
jgi:hypothetical protein